MLLKIPILALAAWLHDIDPVMVRLGPLSIHWYGVSYLLAFALGYLILVALSKRGLIAIPRARVADAVMWMVGGVLIGGRLGYVLFYEPSLLWQFDGSFPFWGVFMIQRGGMASHGGMIGLAVAAWRVSRGWKMEDGSVAGRCPTLHVFDIVALGGVWGITFGRIANFVNGELLGRVIAPARALGGGDGPWWGVKFPQELLERWWQLPQPQRDAAAEAFGVPAGAAAQDRGVYLHLRDLIGHAIMRLQHGSAEARALLEPLVSTRHPSQFYQAFMEGIVTGIVIWAIWARPRRPGIVGAWFLIVYGIGRILTELVRLPDVGLGRVLGLSRGQWLSVLMVAIGAAALAVLTRRPAAKMGGWLSGGAAPGAKHADAGQ